MSTAIKITLDTKETFLIPKKEYSLAKKYYVGGKRVMKTRKGYISTGVVGFYTTFYLCIDGTWRRGDYVKR